MLAHKVPGYAVAVLSLKDPSRAPGDITDAQLDQVAEVAHVNGVASAVAVARRDERAETTHVAQLAAPAAALNVSAPHAEHDVSAWVSLPLNVPASHGPHTRSCVAFGARVCFWPAPS